MTINFVGLHTPSFGRLAAYIQTSYDDIFSVSTDDVQLIYNDVAQIPVAEM